MNAVQISVKEAGEFFADPSQQLMDIRPDTLPDEGFEYWACGSVCGVFHAAMWPNVYAAHYGVKPEAWGRSTGPAKAVLQAFWDNTPGIERIIGWTPESRRHAISFARRLGFSVDGTMDLPSGRVIMQGITL